MNARSNYEQMRDAEIRRLIPKHADAIREKLVAGESPIHMIADGVNDLLCDSHLAEQIVRLSLVVPAAAGMVQVWLTEHVIADQAEVEAVKEVERMERDRQESADEARIGRAAMDRAMSKYPQPMRTV